MESTIKNDRIKFEGEGDDPEVLLKICITLLIAYANEVQGGINFLWKQGAGYGFREFPNYVGGDRNPVTLVQCLTLVSAVGACLEPGRSTRRIDWK